MAQELAKAIDKAKDKIVEMFGHVTCSRPRSASVYPNKRGGGSSTIAIQTSVLLQPQNVLIDVAIWGRLDMATDGHNVTFAASMPRGIGALSSDDEDRLLAHVENVASKWNGYESATDAALARLTGIKPVVKPGEVAPNMRPRLVKALSKPENAAPAA